MILIVILLALLCERLLGSFASWRNTQLFMPWITLVDKLLDKLKLRASGLRLFVLLLPPVLLVGWIQELPMGRLLELGLAFWVLVITLGPRDLGEQVSRYLAAERGGKRSEAAEAGYDLVGRAPPEDPAARTEAILESLFIRACERVIALLFWFVLLGPVGAILYRLVCASTGSQSNSTARSARRLRGWLSWLPAHIVATAYMLSGNFDAAARNWRRHARRHWQTTLKLRVDAANHQLLADVGRAALQQGKKTTPIDTAEEVERAIQLIGRADIIVLAMLAVATLLGWVF